MTYKGKSGKEYKIIEPALGKGGEGSVYKIQGMPGLALKVFDDKTRASEKHEKVLAMLNSPIPNADKKGIAWPIDVVYYNNQFAGYVMPAFDNCIGIREIYSAKYSFSFSEKITIAKNLCVAINSVHGAGQICGDLNPSNIKVDPQNGRVIIVDTDSFHIIDHNYGVVYRCEVGVSEYIPKEIQLKLADVGPVGILPWPGYDLRTAPLPTYTKYSDLFSLAIHIFCLLMNGCHPFLCVESNINTTGKSVSRINPSIDGNITHGVFPFISTNPEFMIPKYAPSFDILPSDIQKLFLRSFVNDNPVERADTEEWYEALSVMQKNIKSCNIDSKHEYPNHLVECPWCKLFIDIWNS